MEYHGDSDALSLHTVATNDRDEPLSTPSLDIPNHEGDRETNNEQDELDEIPDCFKDYKELVESPPAFSRKSRPWIRLQRWQQGPLAVILCLWTVIYCHRALKVQFDADPLTSNVRWLPAALATLLMATTGYVVNRELHWIHQQPAGEPFHGRLENGFKIALTFVVCFIAPFLSAPIFDSYTINNYPIATDGYANLSSWIDLVPNFRGSLPSLVDPHKVDNAWGDWKKTSADRWVVKSNDLKAKFPDSISFTLPRSGRGSSEDRWNNDKGGEKHGVYMPVLPIDQPVFDETQLQHHWTAATQVLAFGLDCEYLNPQEMSVFNASGTGSISVKATDAAGCSSMVTLAGTAFNEEMRESVLILLAGLERGQYGGLRGGASFEAVRSFIEGYRRLLLSGSQLIAYKPAWSRATGEASAALNDICWNKLFLVALSGSFVPEDFKPQASQIQAASCTAKYNLADITLRLVRISHGLFYRRGEMPYKHPSVSVDDIIPYLQDYSRRPMDEDVHKELNEAFLHDASSNPIQGTQWPLTQLREEYGDKYWLRQKPVGSLLMAGKVINRSFVGRLSTAAGLTLQEGLPTVFQPGNKSEIHTFQGQQAHVWKLEREVFQSRRAFRIWLYLASILFSVLLYSLGFVNQEFYNNEYSSPWNVTSIAARAALLRNSRVRDWLRLQQTVPSRLRSPASLRVGYWSVHEEQGKNGWRLDNAEGDFPSPELNMNSLEWKWEDRRSSPWIATPIAACFVAVGLFLHLILQVPMLATSSLARSADQETRLFSVLLGLRGTLNSPYSIWILLSIILPASLLFGLACIWLPFLYNFYRCRQPWVTMKTAQPARLSITLDYWNSWFPLGKAISHRHWAVVLLALGALVQICIPLSSNFLFNPRLDTTHTENFTAVRRYTWREDIAEPTAAAQAAFNYALRHLLLNMISWTYLPRWSSQQGALASFDISKPLPTRKATYGILSTSLLSAHLECDEANISLALSPHAVAEGFLLGVDYLDFSSRPSANPVEARLLDPCVPTSQDSSGDGQLSNKASSSRQSLCSRWWLHNTSSILGHAQPTWLIAMVQGDASKSDQTGRMLFNQKPSATGLICKPVVKTKTGIVTLSVHYSDQATNVDPAKFDPSAGEHRLLDTLASAISYGLNTSIASLNQTDGGVLADGNLISSNAFIGDILSYALHRFGYADRPLTLNTTNLKQAASLVFSSYVSALASATDLLKDDNFSEKVEVMYFRVDSRIAINWRWFSFLLAYVLFCVYILVNFGIVPPRQYLLPFAPEPLLQGLRLLCHSQIVSTMEREMPHPDKLSLRSFHQQVENWGLTYKLGTVLVDGHTQVVVDSAAEVGDEDYRDELDHADHE